MINRILFFVFFLIASFGALAQSDVAEFRMKLNKASTDSAKLEVFRKMVNNNEVQNTDSVIKILEEAYQYFTNSKFDYGRARILNGIGMVYSRQRMLSLAEEKFQMALVEFKKLNDQNGIADVYNLLGVVEGKKNNFVSATKYFLQALKIYENTKNTNGIVSSYLKLGLTNELNRNHAKAIEYYNKGLDLLKNDSTALDYVTLLINVGTLYGKDGHYDTAYHFFSRALNLTKEPKYSTLRISIYSNMGNVYKFKGEKAKAAEYYAEGLRLSELYQLPDEIARFKLNIGILDVKSDPQKALVLFNEALELAEKADENALKLDILGSMVGAYINLGNYKLAYEYDDTREILKDSLYSIDKAAEIANLESNYKLEKTNNEINLLKISEERILKERNITRIVAVLLFISLLTLLYFLFRTMQLNKKLVLRERELQTANQTKDRLFSIIGHDLRNPISSITMVLDLIKSRNLDPDSEAVILGQLHEDALTTLQTLDNLLKWGSAQMTGVNVQPVRFDVKQIMDREFKQLQNIAARKEISMTESIPDNLFVFADSEHFRFVLRNLLYNAIKFTPNNGKISFEVESINEKQVVFKVKDSGIGMSKEKQSKLFSQFGQSEHGTDNESGNGIGLMLCKQFVAENGGELWAESEEGKGSEFKFSLKLHS